MNCANKDRADEENMSKENVSKLMRYAAVALLFAASGAVAGGSRPAAQPAPQSSVTAADLHDISGYWELSFDSRKIPPADLAAGVTKTMLEEKAAADAHAIRYCNLLGTPFVMDPGRPLDIRQGTREVIIAAETNVSPRHIYLDRAEAYWRSMNSTRPAMAIRSRTGTATRW